MNAPRATRIGVRSALALQVREEREPFRPGRPPRRLGRQLVVASARDVAQPGEGAGGREHHAHRLPAAGDRVAERMHTRLRVRLEPGERREHDPRGAEHHGDGARAVDPDAERRRGLVARAGGDRDPVPAPGDLGRLERLGQPRRGELERVEHLVAPAAPGDVEEQRPRCVGDVDRTRAGEPQPHVVLRQQHVRDSRVDVGLVAAYPEQLRSREAGQRAIAGQRDQPLEPDPRLDLLALRTGALVVPENRRAQHPLLGVEAHEPVHLTGEADPGRLDAEIRERGLARLPPVLGILLRPARPGGRERIAALRPGDDLALRRQRERLDAGRADVEPDENGHRGVPSSRSAEGQKPYLCWPPAPPRVSGRPRPGMGGGGGGGLVLGI